MAHCCYIVPPHLLRAIATSEANDESAREAATQALAVREELTQHREQRLALLSQPRGYRGEVARQLNARQSIVPDTLLRHLAESEDVDEETRECARRDLEHIEHVHTRFQETQQQGAAYPADEDDEAQQTLGIASAAAKPKKPKTGKAYRAIYDAKHTQSESALPGTLVRAEGQKPTPDQAVNDAYDNFGHVLKFYKEKFTWNSIDNKGMQVVASCHFGKNYENAFWDPDRMQMVFGDGHDFLNNFTGCIDVICHEMTHAVTEHTAPLDYQGQSGALNEHISDVFGIMSKQMVENETAEDADWLIGEGCIMPGVKGVALRNMKAPGTAYDDPRFGKDPQPDHFKDYKVLFEDNGGVHIYSGIPNKAFYLASKAFGGYSWEKAGQIWWKTMNSGRVPVRCTFLQFSEVTIDVAEEEFGEDAAKIVADAWKEVGVVRKGK